MKSKEVTKKKLDEKNHLERMEILVKAQSVTGKQLAIDVKEGTLKLLDEYQELLDKPIEDPIQKYELYYNGIHNIIKKYLPKGRGFQAERQIIYDEKNIFLNRGKAKDRFGKRGGDGRMTYNQDLKEMVDIISNWVTSTQDPVSLYKAFYELNEKYKYGHQPQYDDTELSFHKAMKKISKVPKPEN